jgi:hypothetical protein
VIPDVDRKAWRALFAAQLGWMLDAMDVLLFISRTASAACAR